MYHLICPITFTHSPRTAGCDLCGSSNYLPSCSGCTTSPDGCNIYCESCNRGDQSQAQRVSVTMSTMTPLPPPARVGSPAYAMSMGSRDSYSVQNCGGRLTIVNNDCTISNPSCNWLSAGEHCLSLWQSSFYFSPDAGCRFFRQSLDLAYFSKCSSAVIVY